MARKKGRRERAFFTEHELATMGQDAMVVLDAVLDGRLERGTIPVPPDVIELRQKRDHLMKQAIGLHRGRYPRRYVNPRNKTERLSGWSGRLGLAIHYGYGEHSYVCVFCQENIGTFNNDGRRFPAVISNRFHLHGYTCGMRYLMELGGLS